MKDVFENLTDKVEIPMELVRDFFVYTKFIDGIALIKEGATARTLKTSHERAKVLESFLVVYLIAAIGVDRDDEVAVEELENQINNQCDKWIDSKTPSEMKPQYIEG